eukprot:9483890-Pyramimonas_sp.AAC.1
MSITVVTPDIPLLQTYSSGSCSHVSALKAFGRPSVNILGFQLLGFPYGHRRLVFNKSQEG